ncbi:MAG: hypothetical protein LUE96_10185 [Lachnospiraceae bacterium]|nr:hypothetical protein [Lachnospiraceae bacterium]
MAVKVQEREIAFVSTYDEDAKGAIEKAVLRHGVSYLIKMDKAKKYGKGHFETKTRYVFQINRFQEDEARAALAEKQLSEDSVKYLT